MYTLTVSYEELCQEQSEKQKVSSMAHTLYDNQRASHRSMVPWRNAGKAVKREFFREARQVLGLA